MLLAKKSCAQIIVCRSI